ncbi:MAG: VWA domain-containing protein [Acidobacteriia bacterium]|nr:VWA domain-containing protein [Terriglobia bacterium]
MRNPILALLLASLCISTALAQTNDKNADKNKAPAARPEQTPVFRQNVKLVNLFFNVKDKHGALVPDLKQDQFDVFEEGKPQVIKNFAAVSNQPLTLGILIDSSGSMQHMLPEEKIVAGDFLRQVITDRDLAFVISFDVSVDLLQDLTTDVRLLKAGLNKARINTGTATQGIPGLGQGPIPISRPKGTLLYDGVYLAANDVLAPQVGRKAVVVLTDGVDQGSRLRLKESIEAAQKADVICYVLLISDPQYGSDPHDMSQLADQTGGRMIIVNRPEKLQKAFSEISNELRSQYYLSYTPTETRNDGKFRKIEVKSKDGYRIQARRGYYAPID